MIKLVEASPPRGRTSQTYPLLDRRSSMDTSSPPSSPERTAEYWDGRVQELRDRRERMRRNDVQTSSDPNRATSPVHANVLDIISSYERDMRRSPPTAAAATPAPPSTSQSHQPTSFEFGFALDRNRADSAHDFSDMPHHLKPSPKSTATTTSPATQHGRTSPPGSGHSRSSSSTNARGLRKEGQTLTNPSPAKPASKPSKTRRWSRNKCPVRPPRPEVSLLDSTSTATCTTATLPPPPPPPTTRIPRKPVALRHQRSMPLQPVPAFAASPPGSASASRPFSPTHHRQPHPQPPQQHQHMFKISSAPAPSPTTPTTMLSEAIASGALPGSGSGDDAYTLEQTVSVWEDDDEKSGIVNYLKWTLHSRKGSGGGGERERGPKSRKKMGCEGSEGGGGVEEKGPRRRRQSIKKMLRVFGCGHTGTAEES
ncbi:hypothetical protein K490DRAFT_54761 [Saccharata proteae CBS 121410]|uniref:Uncharacterized protein n=1 Tax=Saccharata proteae CBS 121410 TaxID=1314787 RepID=A0A9P4I197_9PEZI|nr:hypothetical protein K490DRAFT_54761 [Saccharata proteae CBS 121410]